MEKHARLQPLDARLAPLRRARGRATPPDLTSFEHKCLPAKVRVSSVPLRLGYIQEKSRRRWARGWANVARVSPETYFANAIRQRAVHPIKGHFSHATIDDATAGATRVGDRHTVWVLRGRRCFSGGSRAGPTGSPPNSPQRRFRRGRTHLPRRTRVELRR